MEKAAPSDQEQIKFWLIGFQKGFVRSYNLAFGRHPKEVWIRMDAASLRTWEQNELKIARRIVKKEWLSRPDLLKRTKGKVKNV